MPGTSAADRPTFDYGTEMVLAEPAWYQFSVSPYYTDGHRAFRDKVRQFVDKEIAPFVEDWEMKHVENPTWEFPIRDMIKKAYAAGIYSPMWPVELGGTPPPAGWDSFYDLILNDEITRSLCSGTSSAFGIITMGLPLVLKGRTENNKDVIDRVARECITGEKFISIAVSEPYAGSDVANIRCTAERKGDHYVLNGQKKWITLGAFADYFMVGARTGPAGAKGLSVFLVSRSMKGVSTRRMKLQGHWLSGTAIVMLDDVEVPANHMLCEENHGFRAILHNFNHERWLISVQANRSSRELLAQAMAYTAKRKTFGKTLVEHQVIRQKLADMAMRVESVHALLEHVTHQMNEGMSQSRLGGMIALLKVLAGRTLELCAREAQQIFGGAGYIRGGIGAAVERAVRDVRGVVVPGGSDEILADLAVRQATVLTMRYQMEKMSKAKM